MIIHGLEKGRADSPTPILTDGSGAIMCGYARPLFDLRAPSGTGTEDVPFSGGATRLGAKKTIAWRLKDDTLVEGDPVIHPLSGKVIVTAIYASEASAGGGGQASKDPNWGIIESWQETSILARWPGERPITFQLRSNAGFMNVIGVEFLAISKNPAGSILLLGYKL